MGPFGEVESEVRKWKGHRRMLAKEFCELFSRGQCGVSASDAPEAGLRLPASLAASERLGARLLMQVGGVGKDEKQVRPDTILQGPAGTSGASRIGTT